MCMINGEVWDDEKILKYVGGDEITLDTTVLCKESVNMNLAIASLIIAQKEKELEEEQSKTTVKKRSKFEERLDFVRQQQIKNK